ncbi:polyprenyl synthetase family protein [candidate division KSB1 bacterium]|nr:polyprenyl synthetase family protein [candidate division KSB1 bacterium]
MSLDEIREPVMRELEQVEDEYQHLMDSDVQLISEISDHIISLKGKRIRSLILLLCSGIQGGITPASIRTAALIELLHTATLIHDDVVDDSDMRRGARSVNSIWNNKISILVGDFIFSSILLSLHELSNTEVTRVIVEVTRKMSQGELLQLQYSNNFEIEEEMYYTLIRNKTASLISASCEIGALTSNTANRDHVRHMKMFGELLGIAFQIKDDLLDLMGIEKTLGKPVAKDIIGNTITLPLLYSLKHSKKKDHDRTVKLMERKLSPDEINELRTFIADNGGMEHAMRVAEDHVNRALDHLKMYEDSIYKRSLHELSLFILNREN